MAGRTMPGSKYIIIGAPAIKAAAMPVVYIGQRANNLVRIFGISMGTILTTNSGSIMKVAINMSIRKAGIARKTAGKALAAAGID